MIEYLGHELILIDKTFRIYQCHFCNIKIISSNFDTDVYWQFDEKSIIRLNLTCNEVIVKKLLE